jgi:hypothetical protein
MPQNIVTVQTYKHSSCLGLTFPACRMRLTPVLIVLHIISKTHDKKPRIASGSFRVEQSFPRTLVHILSTVSLFFSTKHYFRVSTSTSAKLQDPFCVDNKYISRCWTWRRWLTIGTSLLSLPSSPQLLNLLVFGVQTC